MRPTALTLLLLLLAGCAGDTKPAPRMAEEAIGAVRLGALEKLDHIAPASRLLDVCEADIVRYGYDAAAGECAAYLAGLFESAAIENLVPRDERRLCPPEAPVPAARLRAIFIDYAKRNLADLHQHRLWIASGALVEAFACR